ncbi:hypothetical protein FSP39_014276 [Pinctada imbricata]|uniref:Cadherin domain-containing protein n=1 Tax=Pinctada imbricata TaxID=66713 RepID=A0AA88XLJ8_PINIB|nr:hypothetical protein FSP39_014276 [Pinctada imbricata]
MFAVDGGWTDWTNYTDCSAECDGGMKSRTRTCTNPVPSGGGANCSGNDYQCASYCSGRVFDMSGAAVNPDHDIDSQTVANITPAVDSSKSGYIVFIRDTRFRTRCCGVISHWEFNATKSGEIRFSVWQQVTTTNYIMVGENVVTVTDQMTNQMYQYEVPSTERIAVIEGYRIGWYSVDFDIINYVNCPDTSNTMCSTGIWWWLRCPKNNVIIPYDMPYAGDTVVFSNTYKVRNYAFDIKIHGSDNTPPTFTSTGISLSMSDQTEVGTVLFVASFTDPDIGDTLSLSINGTSAAYFSIASNGTVNISSSLPHDTAGARETIHEILVVGEDSCYNSVTGTATVTTYNDVPELVYPNTASLQANDSSEQWLAGFNVTDAANDDIDCSISDTSPTNYISYFEIVKNTSKVFSVIKSKNMSIDYCVTSSLVVTIQCSDNVSAVSFHLSISVIPLSGDTSCPQDSSASTDGESDWLIPVAASIAAFAGLVAVIAATYSIIKWKMKRSSSTPVKNIRKNKNSKDSKSVRRRSVPVCAVEPYQMYPGFINKDPLGISKPPSFQSIKK